MAFYLTSFLRVYLAQGTLSLLVVVRQGTVVVEVRQGTVGVDGRGWASAGTTGMDVRGWGPVANTGREWREEDEAEKEEEKEKEENAINIKSNNPHLASGELTTRE